MRLALRGAVMTKSKLYDLHFSFNELIAAMLGSVPRETLEELKPHTQKIGKIIAELRNEEPS
jgi:hypothetical protein